MSKDTTVQLGDYEYALVDIAETAVLAGDYKLAKQISDKMSDHWHSFNLYLRIAENTRESEDIAMVRQYFKTFKDWEYCWALVRVSSLTNNLDDIKQVCEIAEDLRTTDHYSAIVNYTDISWNVR